jgi:hypothetical protein
MQVNLPTRQEALLLREVVQRVESADSDPPLYRQKEAGSRGAEAVIDVLILASAVATSNRERLTEPAQKAFSRLWEKQRADGAWDWLDS